jgi:hypothetical protein
VGPAILFLVFFFFLFCLFVCLFVVGALVFLSLSSSCCLCVDVPKKINVMAQQNVGFGGFNVLFLS